MIFRKIVVFLFLICETCFSLVTGKTNNQEKNDCTKLYNFINGDSNYYDNEICCSSKVNGIECDYEGNFITFERYRTGIKIPDITNFPHFSKIKTLNIDNVGFQKIPDSILNLTTLEILLLHFNQVEVIPPAIKNLKQLTKLGLNNNNIKEIPNEMFNLKQLKTLQLHKNNIEVIPPTIQNLSKLENLNIGSNIIKELPNELFNLTNLKNLLIFNNIIEIIPPDIQKLTKLEYLRISENNLKKLPNEIFKLPNLNILDLRNNPNLNTKIVRFGNSIIKNCYFHNITISCYELHTCETIHLENVGVLSEKINDFDAENEYGKCTSEEIDEIKKPSKNKKYSPFIIKGGIIVGCIIVICNIILAFILIKERRIKQSNKSNISNKDIIRTGSIDKLLKTIENNNSGNKTDIKFDNKDNCNSIDTKIEFDNKDSYNSIDTKIKLDQELFNKVSL